MNNRDKILKVSLALFYEKGYDAVSVQEIVDAAGVTKPTLYYYFGSKYGLLEALLDEGFRLLNENLEPAFYSDREDVRNCLFEVAKVYISYAVTDNKFYFFMLSLMYSAKGNEPYQAIRPHLLALYRSFIEMFERVGDQLGNMNGRQEQFAMGFIGFLNQFAFSYSEKQYIQDQTIIEPVSDEQIRAVVQQFMYGIVN